MTYYADEKKIVCDAEGCDASIVVSTRKELRDAGWETWRYGFSPHPPSYWCPAHTRAVYPAAGHPTGKMR